MPDPLVTKEYREDLGTKDADGLYDYAYCYWEYTFDLGGRRYRARIYADSPADAGVIYLDGGRPAEYDLRARNVLTTSDEGLSRVTEHAFAWQCVTCDSATAWASVRE